MSMTSNDPDRRSSETNDTAHGPLPDPEPPAPSLDGPDPGVFHHEPATRAKTDEAAKK